jgi:hypothetical protein
MVPPTRNRDPHRAGVEYRRITSPLKAVFRARIWEIHLVDLYICDIAPSGNFKAREYFSVRKGYQGVPTNTFSVSKGYFYILHDFNSSGVDLLDILPLNELAQVFMLLAFATFTNL